MKIVFEFEAGEKGGQCRAHILEYAMYFIYGLMQSGPFSEHGPVVGEERYEDWLKNVADQGGVVVYSEGVAPVESAEEAQAYIATKPPVVARMLISGDKFDSERQVPDDANIIGCVADGSVIELSEEPEKEDDEVQH